jgi:hypothetical protein
MGIVTLEQQSYHDYIPINFTYRKVEESLLPPLENGLLEASQAGDFP